MRQLAVNELVAANGPTKLAIHKALESISRVDTVPQK